MTATTADRDSKRQDGRTYQHGLDGGATYDLFKGELLTFDTTGFIRPGVNTAGFRFAGVSTEGVNQTATVADGVTKVKVWNEGVFSFVGASLAATDVGRPVWLTDNQTISLTQTNVGPIGKITEFISATEAKIDIGKASHGGSQFLNWAIGTSAFISDSTVLELAVGLAAAITGVLTVNLATAPTRVLSTDLTVTSGAITCARQTTGTDEVNFNYAFAGY